MNTRYSSSLIKVYRSCPFRFYCKVTDQEKDATVEESYGLAGNTVHYTIEYYYKNLREIELEFALIELETYFNILWDECDINNPYIEKSVYWDCVINAIKFNPDPTHLEYEFNVKLNGINFIGYADVMNNKEHWIGDWKTSTYKKAKVEGYKEQLKHYAWAYWREFGVVPEAWVFFNKANKLFRFKFSEETVLKVEDDIHKIIKEVDTRFKDMRFERQPTRSNCFFCPYKKVCSTDLLRENSAPVYEVIFNLVGNKLTIEGSIPDVLHRKIEKQINFEIKNAFFVKQAMAQRGVKYDGIKRLYHRKPTGAQTFIGYLNLIYNELKQYASSSGKKLRLVLRDYRDKQALEQKINTKSALITDFDLYDFQKKAVEALLKNRWGVVEIGTGGGKTAIAAEAIRQLGLKTLFLIDNKDLLLQTKKEYEQMLGVDCGIVGMGKREWNHSIVLATIQTMAKYVKEYETELASIPLVIFDETHIIASKSFETVSKYLINSFYRFGFSATARRDDWNDNIIYAHTGTIVYKKRAQDLIQEGVLVDPEAIFYNYGSFTVTSDTWQNEYQDGIVDNELRNSVIKEIAENYVKEGKQVMILTKMIRHGDWFKSNIKNSDLIYGKTDDDLRVEILDDFKAGKLNILIGNLKIFNKGINIKNLDVIINASGNAGDVLTVQTIGRALRKNKGKTKAYYVDFMDSGNYLNKNSMSRINALKAEDYNVDIRKYSGKNI